MTSHVVAYRSFELLFGMHTFHFNCFFEDFNCVFTQIRCLSRVLINCKDRLDPKTGKRYWKCDNRKCKGLIITSSDDSILKQTAHNMHGPDIPQIEVQESMARIREAASKTQETTAKILNKELSCLLNSK